MGWKQQCLRRLQVLLTTPLKKQPLGLLGTENKVPPKPFSPTVLSRKECGSVFQEEKRTEVSGFLVTRALVEINGELEKTHTEALLRIFCLSHRDPCFMHQIQALLREEIYS